MSKKKIILIVFMILAVIQLSVPLFMAWHWEDIYETGRSYRWRTAPVDPYDALRGRYIDLSFQEAKGPIIGGNQFSYGQTVYALLAKDENGFAYITGITANKPANGDYLKVKAGYMENGSLTVTLPFKRFYIREELAPQAEDAYRENAGKDGVVAVRIKDGLGVVEQLYIGDKTLEEYLRNEGNEKMQ